MKIFFRILIAIFTLFQIDAAQASGQVLKYGIWDAKPYSFMKNGKITGLDLDIFSAILAKAGLPPADFSASVASWSESLKKIEAGTSDAIGGATETEARKKWGKFSVSYRNETNVAVTAKTIQPAVSFSNVATLIAYIKTNKSKVGIVKGVVYNSAELTNFLKETPPKDGFSFVEYDSYEALLSGLVSGAVHIAIQESVIVASLLVEQGKQDLYTITDIGASAPQHFLFSSKTVTDETLAKINKAIGESGAEIAAITAGYTTAPAKK